VASEYSVNIRLNTAQVKKDLKTIGTEISNLGKTQEKSSKTTLSATDKKLKLDQKILTFQNRILTVGNSRLKTITKENKLSKTKSLLTRANNQALEGEFDLSKKNILKAIQQIKLLQKEQLIKRGIQTQTTKKVKVEDTINKQLRERAKTLGQIVKLRNLGTAAGRLAGRFELEETLQTRGPGGRMLALPSSEMLEQRVRGAGQMGGFSRGLSTPNFMQRMGATSGFDVQSALISGGFPLLFGQGPITAAAGAVGGGVGGMFGQMGGFAGGIAATAAVQSISSALNAVSELGRALSKPTENIQTLVDKLALANTPTGDLALKLEKLGLTSSAASVLIEKFAEDFGRTPLEVEKMTKELDKFNQEMAKFGLRLQFIVADVFGPMVTLINKLPLGTIAKFFTGRGFDFLNPGGALTPNIMTLPQKKLKVERQRGSGIQNNLPSNLQDVGAFADQLTYNREIKPLKQALEIEKLRLTTSSEKLNIMKEEFELENLTNELKIAQAENEKVSTEELTTKISKLTAQVDLQEQVVANAKALVDPFKKLSNIISMDIGNGIKGLIQGTSTLGDLLGNVLNKLSDAFLNMAIFGNFGGGSVTGGLLGMFGFANGGKPPVGRPSIVGERGPELFVPDRAGTIIPNHELGGMGGTNIVVNVDASGSSVEGNEQDSRELGRLISVAVQSELVKQKRPGGILA